MNSSVDKSIKTVKFPTVKKLSAHCHPADLHKMKYNSKKPLEFTVDEFLNITIYPFGKKPGNGTVDYDEINKLIRINVNFGTDTIEKQLETLTKITEAIKQIKEMI